jgi:hypothetical protein
LAGTAPDIAGIASSGGRLAVKGKLRAEGLKLARNGTPAHRAVEFDFNTEHDPRKHAGALQAGDIHIGAATAMEPVFKPDLRGLAKAQAKTLLQSEAQKGLKGSVGEAAGDILDNLVGGKKK